MSPLEHRLLNRVVWAEVLLGLAIPPELSKSDRELATDLHKESLGAEANLRGLVLPVRQLKSYSPRRPDVNCSTKSREPRVQRAPTCFFCAGMCCSLQRFRYQLRSWSRSPRSISPLTARTATDR
jgi:hypothetical protein